MDSTHRRLDCCRKVKTSGQESPKEVAIGSFLHQEGHSHRVDEPQLSFLCAWIR